MEIITACRVCKSSNIKTFFDLGSQPLANSLLKNLNEPEKFYPLSLSFCENCSLVQPNQTVDPKELFLNYVWVTGTSKTANKFAERNPDKWGKRTVGTNIPIISEEGACAARPDYFLVPPVAIYG